MAEGIDEAFEKVVQFKMALGAAVASHPTKLSDDAAFKRGDFLKEEVEEFLAAGTLVDQVDALVDTLYFVLGTFAELGVAPNAAFEIVHRANMSKLDSNGRNEFDVNGKLLKPGSWNGPEAELRELLARIVDEAES